MAWLDRFSYFDWFWGPVLVKWKLHRWYCLSCRCATASEHCPRVADLMQQFADGFSVLRWRSEWQNLRFSWNKTEATTLATTRWLRCLHLSFSWLQVWGPSIKGITLVLGKPLVSSDRSCARQFGLVAMFLLDLLLVKIWIFPKYIQNHPNTGEKIWRSEMRLILSQGHPYVIWLMYTSTCTQSWRNLRGPACRETQPEERFLSSLTPWHPQTARYSMRSLLDIRWLYPYILFEMLDLDCSDGLSVQVHVAEQALAQGLEHSEAIQTFLSCFVQNPSFVIVIYLSDHIASTSSWTSN